MENFKSHFRFNKQERSGIFFLLLIIVLLQVGYFIFMTFSGEKPKSSFSLNDDMQVKIDVLKKDALKRDSLKIYPFNPNFITDYKGYTLGMSVSEIDRLHQFRAKNEYVNSSEDFQKVTKVSDSLLKVISPYFKFPEWTQKRKPSIAIGNQPKAIDNSSLPNNNEKGNHQIRDINTTTAEELKKINGIGEVLSKRIIKFRNRLGGFLIEEQLYDVYGLEPDVVKRILSKYKVFNKPVIRKLNINSDSAEEIASLIYITYEVAEEIVFYREVNGPFSSFNELENIEGFPANKIDRIALYLSL